MINAFYGLEMTADSVVKLGQTILSTERDFNKRAGFTSAQDRLPHFFKVESVAPHNEIFDIKDEDLDSVFNWETTATTN